MASYNRSKEAVQEEIDELNVKINEMKAKGQPVVDETQRLKQLQIELRKSPSDPNYQSKPKDKAPSDVASIMSGNDEEKAKEYDKLNSTQQQAEGKAQTEYDQGTMAAQNKDDLKAAQKNAVETLENEGGAVSSDKSSKGDKVVHDEKKKKATEYIKAGKLDEAYMDDLNITFNDLYEAMKDAGYTDDQIESRLEHTEWARRQNPGHGFGAWKKQRDEERAKAKNKSTSSVSSSNGEAVESEEEAAPEADPQSEEGQRALETRRKETQEEIDRAVGGAKWDANNSSILQAILDPSSEYSGVQRVTMALKLIGQLVGGVALANGMSLLGDNSYFSKIGDAINYEDYQPQARKEAQKLYASWIAETAADTKANNKTLDSLELSDDARKALSSLGPEIAIIASDKNALIERLKTLDIPANEIQDVAEKVYAARTGLQFSSRRSAEALTAMSSAASANESRKQAETATKKANYEYDKELWSDIAELKQKKTQLLQLKNKMYTDSIKDRTEAIAAYGAMYGQIGSSVKSAAASNSLSENSQSNWEASTTASGGWGPFSGEVSAGGGHSWGSNTNTSESTSDSETYNANYEAALKVMESKTNAWWNDKSENGGAQVLKAAQESIDATIKTIDAQIAYIEERQAVNDAVIPNGEIESVNLKDGTTLEVNPEDGAILTTNPVSENLLSFDEGEVNPFDYLGYEGDKKECEYYDTIFEDKPVRVNTFDEAMELLK